MIREDALNILHGMKADNLNLADAYTKDKYEALDIAIKALEQEQCDDCISRQAAKKALEDRFMELQKRHDDKRYETNYCLNTILELPPVNPQPTTGHWIPIDERLPMNDDACCDDDVLVSCKDGFVRIGFCMGYDELGNREWCVADKYSEVVAWMPLPEPYKAERIDKE